MSNAPRHLARRLSLLLLALATLVFAAPAFDSHACVPGGDAAVQVLDVEADACDCGDCGATCAGGCCHVSPSGLPMAAAPTTLALRFVMAEAWSDAAAPPMSRPAGPDRPPRP